MLRETGDHAPNIKGTRAGSRSRSRGYRELVAVVRDIEGARVLAVEGAAAR